MLVFTISLRYMGISANNSSRQCGLNHLWKSNICWKWSEDVNWSLGGLRIFITTGNRVIKQQFVGETFQLISSRTCQYWPGRHLSWDLIFIAVDISRMSRGFCIIFAMSRNSNLWEWRHLSACSLAWTPPVVVMRPDIMSHCHCHNVTLSLSQCHADDFLLSIRDTVGRNKYICQLPTLEYWNHLSLGMCLKKVEFQVSI